MRTNLIINHAEIKNMYSWARKCLRPISTEIYYCRGLNTFKPMLIFYLEMFENVAFLGMFLKDVWLTTH